MSVNKNESLDVNNVKKYKISYYHLIFSILALILLISVGYIIVKDYHEHAKINSFKSSTVLQQILTIKNSIKSVSKIGSFAGYFYVLTNKKPHAYFVSTKRSIFGKKYKFKYQFFIAISNGSLSDKYFNRVCHELKSNGLKAITIKTSKAILLYQPVYCNKIFKGSKPLLEELPGIPMFWFKD